MENENDIVDAEDLNKSFRDLRPQYEAFTESLERLIKTLISNQEIDFFQIEKRTKTEESFSEKIQREEKQNKYSSLSDLTDLSGIRIITYLQEDCDTISEIIRGSFAIDIKNSVAKIDQLDPDKFGYLSTHFVVSLPENRLDLPEFSAFRNMKAEIQIRTLLQHTWAAIDWKFRYKGQNEAPKQLRRRLFRISALLEAADIEFSSVKKAIEDLREGYSKSINNKDLEIEINIESLKSYSEESDAWKNAISIAKASGLKCLKIKDNLGGIEKLSRSLNIVGIKTLESFDEELRRIEPELNKFFSYMVSERKMRFPNKTPQLLDPAAIRYAILAFSSDVKRNRAVRDAPLAVGYSSIISSFAKKSNS